MKQSDKSRSVSAEGSSASADNVKALHPGAQSSVPETWPYFAEDEIAAVAAVMRSGRVNQWTGDKVFEFERQLAELCAVPHAIALVNGSVALELALRVLGIGPGDEVIVTPRSFIASASAVNLAGATPVFADVDAASQNISANTISLLIGPKTKAIIPVHLAGWPCDMPAIMALAERHKLHVIEDCAQAVGATIEGRPVGSFGHMAAFSFCQDKIITTGGEGGALLLQDEAHWRKAWSFKDHGKSYDLAMASPSGLSYRWLHQDFGTNWRMTEIQAAVGLAQLKKLDRWLNARAQNAGIWRAALAPLACLEVPDPPQSMRHAYYKFYAFVKPERLVDGVDRDTILKALADGGVRALYGSCAEIYRERAYADQRIARRPTAKRLGETSLMFEVHPTLDRERLKATAARAAEIIKRFERA